MEREEVIGSEADQVVTEVGPGNERLQINIAHNGHPGAAETEAGGEDADIEMDRLILRACRNIENVLRPVPLGSSPTIDVNSELDRSLEQRGTGEGSIDSGAGLRASNTADTLRPTESASTTDASIELLEMLLVVKTTDLPEEFRKCTICRESLGDGENSEVPVRLPCQHVFGKLCISKWISNNSCPLCRAAIFPTITASAPALDGTPRESPVPGRGELPYANLAEEQEIRALVGRVRDFANEHIRIAELRASFRARFPVSPRPPSEDMVALDEVYTRVTVALTNTMAALRDRYLPGSFN